MNPNPTMTVDKEGKKQLGYWRFDGQIKWFVKFEIPLSIDNSWRLSNEL